MSALVVILFLAANAAFALGRSPRTSSAEYVLGGRRIGSFALAATLAASNLSAFTVLGVGGAAYRIGWGFFPAMAFGTAFMALSFALLGLPLRRLSAERGWTTPAHFIAGRFDSPLLGKAFSGLALFFTVPYLAIQTGSAGELAAAATGLPGRLCSALIVAVVALYVVRGGMRSVVRTDVFQIAALVVLSLGTFFLILRHAGRGTTDAPVPAADPETGLSWLLGYYVLWFLADPMFPHFIQRFYAAGSDRALLRSMAAYPFIALGVFLPMSAVGILGARLVPGLEGAAADRIFLILADRAAPAAGSALLSAAVLAAILSTMDSQLLSCASILSDDFFPASTRGPGTTTAAALFLAGAAWAVSLRPPRDMLTFLNAAAFPGYAILAPVAFAALYLPAAGAAGAGTALAAGAALVLLQTTKLFAPPIPPVLFHAAVQTAILVLSAALPRPERKTPLPPPIPKTFVPPLMVLPALSLAFYGRRNGGPAYLGMPGWVWLQILLIVALGGVFMLIGRRAGREAPRDSEAGA